MYERDSKRMRPFPSNPTDNGYPTPPQAPYNRSAPPAMPPRNPNLGPPIAYNSQQHPRMLPHNPPIHPPNQQALAYQQRQGPFPQAAVINPPHRAPLPPQQPQLQAGFTAQFPGQPTQPGSVHNSFDRLPPPPRKDFIAPVADGGPTGPIAGVSQGGVVLKSAGGAAKDGSDQPMSFKDFLLKQPDNISSHAAQEAYDEYVKGFTMRKPNKFFDQHKNEEWFRERYDPEYVSKRILRIREEVIERAKVYRDLWDRGGSQVCAPELTAFPEGSKYPKKDEPSPGDVEPEDEETKGNEEGDTAEQKGENPATEEAKEKDDLAVEKEDDNDQAVSSDVKMEETDATAAKKEEEEEVPGEDKPSMAKEESGIVSSQKGEPSIEPESKPDLDEVMENKQQGEQKKGPSPPQSTSGRPLVLPLRREHQKDTIFMRCIPMNLCREDLTAVLKHGGDGPLTLNLRRLKLGDINPHRSLERFGWAVYDSEETASRALSAVKGVKVISEKTKGGSNDGKNGKSDGDGRIDTEEDLQSTYVIDCMLNLERKKKFSQGRILPSEFGSAERMRFDVEQSVKMMRCLDSDRKMDPNLNPLTDELLQSLENDGQRLDHIVTYLREVHYFCYYSGNEFLEDPTSMPPQELRPRPDRGRHMSEADNRLLRRIDERARWVLERDYDRPRSNSDNGDAAADEVIRKWLNANTKHEGEGRYRCGLPPHKLFKGPEFVHKHLRTKHGDKMKQMRDKALLDTYRANFENDASKDEVVKIYHEGMAGGQEADKGLSVKPGGNGNRNIPMGNGFGQPGTAMPVGVYSPYMGLGMQFPLMMPTAGFPGGYAGAPGYANAMAFAGRGMQTPGVGGPGMTPSGMMPPGRNAHEGNSSGHHRAPPRRDSGRGGPRGRRGGLRRGGGDYHRGGHGDSRPADPRSRGSRRAYNDLDAPSNGPSFDLVRYDDV